MPLELSKTYISFFDLDTGEQLFEEAAGRRRVLANNLFFELFLLIGLHFVGSV